MALIMHCAFFLSLAPALVLNQDGEFQPEKEHHSEGYVCDVPVKHYNKHFPVAAHCIHE